MHSGCLVGNRLSWNIKLVALVVKFSWKTCLKKSHSLDSGLILNIPKQKSRRVSYRLSQKHKKTSREVGVSLKRTPLLKFHQFWSAMQKNTIVEISSNLKRHRIPEGIIKRLKNYFCPNWKQQKPFLWSKKQNFEKKNRFFFKMSPVCRIVPKILGSRLCS